MPLLQAKPITMFCNVNDFQYGNQWTVNSGDTLTLYFQIIDINQAQVNYNSTSNGIFGFGGGNAFTGITAVGTTAGTRYLVGIGSSNQPYRVSVTFPSIDPNQLLTVWATQADPNDSSIWSVTLAPSMAVGGGNVQFTVYQGNTIMKFSVLNMLATIFPTSNGMC